MSGAARDPIDAEYLAELRAGLRVPPCPATVFWLRFDPAGAPGVRVVTARGEPGAGPDQVRALCRIPGEADRGGAGRPAWFPITATAWNGQAYWSQTNGASRVGFSHLYARPA